MRLVACYLGKGTVPSLRNSLTFSQLLTNCLFLVRH